MPGRHSRDQLRTIGEAIGAARALLDCTYEALLDIDANLANAVADAVDLIDAAVKDLSVT